MCDESAHRPEVEKLVNLEQDSHKTVDLTVNLRTRPPNIAPYHHPVKWNLQISGIQHFLEPKVDKILVIKKAHQMVYSLHQLKKFKKFFKLQLLLIYFYTAIIFSIQRNHCLVWVRSQIWQEKTAGPMRSAEKLIRANLPYLYTSKLMRRLGHITEDTSHPGHKLFPPCRHYRPLTDMYRLFLGTANKYIRRVHM